MMSKYKGEKILKDILFFKLPKKELTYCPTISTNLFGSIVLRFSMEMRAFV